MTLVFDTVCSATEAASTTRPAGGGVAYCAVAELLLARPTRAALLLLTELARPIATDPLSSGGTFSSGQTRVDLVGQLGVEFDVQGQRVGAQLVASRCPDLQKITDSRGPEQRYCGQPPIVDLPFSVRTVVQYLGADLTTLT